MADSPKSLRAILPFESISSYTTLTLHITGLPLKSARSIIKINERNGAPLFRRPAEVYPPVALFRRLKRSLNGGARSLTVIYLSVFFLLFVLSSNF